MASSVVLRRTDSLVGYPIAVRIDEGIDVTVKVCGQLNREIP